MEKLYGFRKIGESFFQCSNFTEKTCDLQCSVPDGETLKSVSLADSLKKTGQTPGPFTGNDCEWIDLNKVANNDGCVDGKNLF